MAVSPAEGLEEMMVPAAAVEVPEAAEDLVETEDLEALVQTAPVMAVATGGGGGLRQP